MPKKKKKSKSRKKTSKRKKVKKRKKILRRKKKIKSKSKKVKINNEGSTQELIFKTKPEWVKSGLINKSQYQNKYTDSIKNNNSFSFFFPKSIIIFNRVSIFILILRFIN